MDLFPLVPLFDFLNQIDWIRQMHHDSVRVPVWILALLGFVHLYVIGMNTLFEKDREKSPVTVAYLIGGFGALAFAGLILIFGFYIFGPFLIASAGLFIFLIFRGIKMLLPSRPERQLYYGLFFKVPESNVYVTYPQISGALYLPGLHTQLKNNYNPYGSSPGLHWIATYYQDLSSLNFVGDISLLATTWTPVKWEKGEIIIGEDEGQKMIHCRVKQRRKSIEEVLSH